MSQFWKQVRSDSSWQKQWQRRLQKPAPFVLSEIHRRMVQRTEIVRLPEGFIRLEGWLHPDVYASNPLAHLQRPVIGPLVPEVLPAFKREQAKNWRFMKELLGRFTEEASKREAAVRWMTNPELGALNLPCAMVWSPLHLQSTDNPKAWVQSWFEKLQRGGALFFTCLGPDSGQEIKAAAQSLGLDFPDFADMHDWGDLLVGNGFSDPVMEMEKITLSYANAESLLQDWRACFGNSLLNRGKALSGRAFKARLLEAIESGKRDGEGRLLLTIEAVYGHAWKVKATLEPGVATIALDQIKRKNGKVQ